MLICVLRSRQLDVPLLISWLSARQYAPEGGFSGRTNKLVDGCYSHWVGGCWPLLEACIHGPSEIGLADANSSVQTLYSREGLIRYILCCCQDLGRRGGLRDKPSKYENPHLISHNVCDVNLLQIFRCIPYMLRSRGPQFGSTQVAF